MVKGPELFSEHFRKFTDQYVLIGGSACDLAMDDAGVDFRATGDLDIVLCAEALSRSFVVAFWAFIDAGGYLPSTERQGLDHLCLSEIGPGRPWAGRSQRQ